VGFVSANPTKAAKSLQESFHEERTAKNLIVRQRASCPRRRHTKLPSARRATMPNGNRRAVLPYYRCVQPHAQKENAQPFSITAENAAHFFDLCTKRCKTENLR
jgi:hypothetical protein